MNASTNHFLNLKSPFVQRGNDKFVVEGAPFKYDLYILCMGRA